MYLVSQLAASYYCITQSLAMARAILKIIPQVSKWMHMYVYEYEYMYVYVYVYVYAYDTTM